MVMFQQLDCIYLCEVTVCTCVELQLAKYNTPNMKIAFHKSMKDGKRFLYTSITFEMTPRDQQKICQYSEGHVEQDT
jgi:hypothetical protein